MRRPLLPLAAAAALLFSPPCARAYHQVSGERHGLDAGGSIRTIAGAFRNYDEPLLFGDGNKVDGLSNTILRLTVEGDAGERGGYEIHLVQEFLFTTARGGAGTAAPLGIADTAARYRALDLTWTWLEEEDAEASLYLDRLNAEWSRGKADLTVGRQAINFSQAWFWNPLDIFLPFDPEAFDRSYKPGVDALRTDVSLGRFSALTFVYAAGNRLEIRPSGDGLQVTAEDFTEDPWYGSALLARLRTNARHFDLTLQGGKVYGGFQAGGGFSGEAGPLGLRGEATWLFAAGDGAALLPDPRRGGLREVQLIDDHAEVVIGADHRFESSLYLSAEYFFNGAGEEDDPALALARIAVGETTNIGVHYGALLASYEFHPILTGQLSLIHSFSDGSDLLSPVFTWSVADEAECIFGAILGFGDRPALRQTGEGAFLELQSEFGTYPDFTFLELIFYF